MTRNDLKEIAIVYDRPTDVPVRKDGTNSEFEMMPHSSLDRISTIVSSSRNCNISYCSTEDFFESISTKKNSLNYDCVFNLSSGIAERYRYAQSPMALEVLGIPYSGSDVYTILLCRDKYRTNKLLESIGVLVPKSIYWHEKLEVPLSNLDKSMFPCFIKPNSEGGSVGVTTSSVVTSVDDLSNEIQRLNESYDEGLIIEEFIDGFEVTVLVLGNIGNYSSFSMVLGTRHKKELSPMFYRTQSEKQDAFETGDRTWFSIPVLLNAKIEERLHVISEDVCTALNIRDIARLDFRVRGDDIYLIEVNAQPAFTEGNTSLHCISKLFFNDEFGVEKKFIEEFFNRICD